VLKRVDSETELREALAAEPWEIVLCDHGLPSFSSTEALRLVRDTGSDIRLSSCRARSVKRLPLRR